MGKSLKALAELRQATALDPRNPRLHYAIAVTLTELRRYREAEQQLEQALAIEPHDYDVMTYRVRMLFVSGRPQAARRALAQIPPNVDPQGSVSALHFWSAWLARKPQQALAALAHAPDWVMGANMLYSVPADLLRGEAQAMQGDRAVARKSYEDARTTLQAALKRQPAPYLWGALGLTEAGLGNDDEAVKDGQQAVQLLPVTKNALYGTAHLAMLAAIYARTNKPEQAVKLLRRLLSMPAGGPVSVPLLRLDPTWDPLRKNPRFQALLKQYGKQIPAPASSAASVGAPATG
ncbi:MAG: tetratricopeptide repeat protein [Gammaproteobacteria bacterium]